MSTTYGTQSSITIPSDGDTIDAADVNTPLAAIWDQHDLIADTTALKAILVPTHGLMRYVRGLGSYVFVTSGTYSAVTAVTPYVLTATDGTAGRWVNSGWYLANQTVVRSMPANFGYEKTNTAIAVTDNLLSTHLYYPIPWTDMYHEGRFIKFWDCDAAAANAKHLRWCLNPYLISGATITSVKAIVAGNGAHGALPLLMPTLSVVRVDIEAMTQVALKLAQPVSDTSASTAAFDAMHNIELVPDQNAEVDLSKTAYYAIVTNEGNTNALSEFQVRGFEITMTTKGLI